MSASRPTGNWDDARLDAAFHGRFGVEPPAGLADRMHAQLLVGRPSPRRSWWSSLAFVAVGILVGAGLVLVSAGLIGPAPTVLPSGAPVVSPSATPSPALSAATAGPSSSQTIAGLPVLSVDDAIAVQDSGAAEEIAVDGWFQAPLSALPCPILPAGFVGLEGTCMADFTWLMRDRESLISVTARFFGTPPPVQDQVMRVPNGPAIHPVFITTTAPALKPIIDPTGISSPAGVVFIGHFNDRRSALCTAERVSDCKAHFVVDAVASVDDKAMPLPQSVDLTDHAPDEFVYPDQQRAIDAFLASHPGLLSTVLAPTDQALAIEPTIFKTNLNRPILHFLPVIWLATGFEADPSSGKPMSVTWIVDAQAQLWASGGTDPEFQFVFLGPSQAP